MKRNLSIDILRFILSILIIALHINLFSEFGFYGDVLRSITRCAVPLFLIISGYYLFNILNDWRKVRKYLLRILLMYVIWMVVYFPFYGDFSSPFKVMLFFLTWIIGYYHLWYLSVLLLGVLMLYFVKRTNLRWMNLLLIAIGLYITGWCIQYLKIIDLSHPVQLLLSWNFPYRNFLFIGFPFLVIGCFIKKYEEKLTGLGFKELTILGIISCLLLLTEGYVFNKIGLGFEGIDIYASLLLFCPVIFLIALNKKKYTSDNYLANYSSGIYFIHPLIISIILPNTDFSSWNQLILITVFSIMLSSTLIMINKRLVQIL